MRRLATLLLLVSILPAQDKPPNGPQRPDPGWHAIAARKVHVSPTETLEDFFVTHRQVCKLPGDWEHWLEGYRKAGLVL